MQVKKAIIFVKRKYNCPGIEIKSALRLIPELESGAKLLAAMDMFMCAILGEWAGPAAFWKHEYFPTTGSARIGQQSLNPDRDFCEQIAKR